MVVCPASVTVTVLVTTGNVWIESGGPSDDGVGTIGTGPGGDTGGTAGAGLPKVPLPTDAAGNVVAVELKLASVLVREMLKPAAFLADVGLDVTDGVDDDPKLGTLGY